MNQGNLAFVLRLGQRFSPSNSKRFTGHCEVIPKVDKRGKILTLIVLTSEVPGRITAERNPTYATERGSLWNSLNFIIPDLMKLPSGAFPQIIPMTSPQDEIARVTNEVEGFVKKGMPRKHLLLLHPDGGGKESDPSYR